ncbi:hypothetical protein I3843_13G089600 [Carya illinoinensis]|uniref:Transmembrane protein n=1 Tax=Carya illinoinensis TaxID=32201 RepID=A0A8T1NR10_CARIL|nr:uncharacterized protein LOC122293016 [Carya illinoinensis]KAG2673655.1 hypothetical protein I3760_13G102000 [Carya illinoinensis]KAG6631624.1 hypothetical protein CIPAW_13G103800 [Carya illinoinensis]KAG6681628.1 hypothetical protein I3842_13G102700 [Carya illinoinensis]KAG7949950.1 hypothetical protein I3843_13G089600 [Carya illinoinensis]
MLQSSSSSSSRGLDEGYLINVGQQPHVKRSPIRRKDDTGGCLPLYNPGSPKRETPRSRTRVAEKWIHVIPVIVLLCFFILWWFSYTVNITFKDGKITSIHRIERSAPVNDTQIDLLVLAVATSSIASVPLNLISNDEAEVHPASKTD